jgi:hypothetical protein
MYSLFVVNLLKPDISISIGLARLAETSIRKARGKQEGQSSGAMDKILSSSIGGALATWNQPIEVIRVEVFCCSTRPRSILTVGRRCKTCLRRRLPQLTAQRS